MAILIVVSGPCGKGQATYDHEHFDLPDGARRPIETLLAIEVHGGVAADAREGWTSDVLRGLKGGLSMAADLELSGTLSLAAGAVGAGLSALGSGDAKPRALAEMIFVDGVQILALVDPALPPLLLHDRDVVRRTIERLSEIIIQAPEEASGDAGLLADAREAAFGAAGAVGTAAGAALTSARSLLRWGKPAGGE